jgi:molybdopterin converting factor small subunit
VAADLRVKALLFASYADAFGAAEVSLALKPGSTVADAVAALRALSPRDIPARPLVAVNERYAGYEDTLTEGDEVALIPPVAGG